LKKEPIPKTELRLINKKSGNTVANYTVNFNTELETIEYNWNLFYNMNEFEIKKVRL